MADSPFSSNKDSKPGALRRMYQGMNEKVAEHPVISGIALTGVGILALEGAKKGVKFVKNRVMDKAKEEVAAPVMAAAFLGSALKFGR